VKADAARHLFAIDASALTWAVVDSGIDARHPAFAVVDSEGKPIPAENGKPEFPFRTRVKATYDFSLIRHVLASDHNALRVRIAYLKKLDERRSQVSVGRARAWDAEKEALEGLLDWLGDSFARRARTTKDLRAALLSGRAVDWDLLGSLLEIPHQPESYRPPEHNHGTHVAGIMAGSWRRADEDRAAGRAERNVRPDLVGVAPDLRLIDLRVLGADGTGDEFAVIAALQFLRHLNAHKDTVVVHGANLSLSIRHEVVNYACGATPVCEEAERLVASGVVVVAAAGNRGHAKIQTVDGPSEIYQSISITDPGNAEGVLTVGATHRSSPHTYGVSYFSSRGPTGDGRSKPDLVAPGEKITSAVPCSQATDGRLTPDACELDGTSMAAPHVSGVAALLLARHRELAGKPRRVKEILTATATDLGRERYFQGAGMVDALRALQSI
jgi:subtilisin family serine protease